MARNTLDNVTPLRPGLTATANVLSTAPADDRHIPFIDLQAQRKRLGQGIEDAIARVLDHGRFVAGPEIDELEEAVGTREVADIEEEFGDVLFAVVNLARHLDIDPEKALTGANRKFERRFRDMEREINANGKRMSDFNLETLGKYWRAAKKPVG